MPTPAFDLERYRPLYAIGRGGMGIVEVALEKGEDGFERVCALKRLLPEGARDKRHTDMFLREARLAALLSHPNVVHGFAFGEAKGELFLAMEYVEGEPLSRVLARLREKKELLSPALAAFLVAEICEGLHAVHELADENGTSLSVVHRDVSPHNVMIAYEGGLKLLDFGVAKIEAEPGLTRTGEVKGKTAYMSPEQAMGEASLDRRSDLYSVGAVLFECVSGRKMWEGTEMEVLRHLALDEPPALESVRADTPNELRALCKRLVAKKPDDRPTSAAEVARALRSFADDQGRDGRSEIGALMHRLFAEDEAKRKAELEKALAMAAPGDADALADDLRASLAPERHSASELVASVGADTTRERPRSIAIALVAVLVAMAVTAALALRPTGTSQVAGDPTVAPQTSSAPIVPSAAPSSPAAVVTSAVPSATASTPASGAEKMPVRPSKPAQKPPPHATPHLDVDPNPI